MGGFLCQDFASQVNRISPTFPLFAVLALVSLFLGGCVTPRKLITDPAPSAESGDSEKLPSIYNPHPTSVLHGKASYYWEPQPTASGERFNPNKLTAAHKTLPLHSVVRVTNLSNLKSVVVRINDRGPYIRGRVIDLSRAAAEKISMTKAGVVQVRIDVFKKIQILSHPNRRLKINPQTGAFASANLSESMEKKSAVSKSAATDDTQSTAKTKSDSPTVKPVAKAKPGSSTVKSKGKKKSGSAKVKSKGKKKSGSKSVKSKRKKG